MLRKLIQLAVQHHLKRQSGGYASLFRQSCSCRYYSTETSSEKHVLPPPPLGGDKVYEPKIVQLVDNISQLTLREVADLNDLLKTTLNIKDVAVVASAAPVGAAAEPKEEEEKVPERDEFVVKLVEFTASDKIKLIKALKIVKPSLNLVQAKKFVESVPQVVGEDLPKQECEEIKKALEEAGGKVEIV